MTRHATAALLALVTALAASPATARGQGSRVIVTVFQSVPGISMIPAVGAAVCLSADNNTRITNGSGQVTFDNIIAGQWTLIAWKSGFRAMRSTITSPGTATIPAIITLAARSSEASPCILPPVARLGEEVLTERGRAPLTTDGQKLLDCKTFGSAFVMVGITGKMGAGVDEIRLVCAPMRADGTLSPIIQFTGRWDTMDNAGTSFGRHCAAGRVVSGLQVTVQHLSGQIRSMSIQCRLVGTSGLTSGTPVTLAPAGTPTTTSLDLDRCSGGRPARAMRVGADAFTPILLNSFAPFIIATSQLICEQPVMP